MSEPKVQLVDPQGNINLPGLSATGVITATSFDGISNSSATGLTGTPDLDVGIVTATSFVGQGDGHAAGLAGTPELNLGVTTATSFVGDAVGKAAGLTGTPNLNVGLITATSFVGFVTGNVTGNISGLAASITPGANLGVGVCTAIQYHGDGSTLTGAGSSAYIAQNITATGAETIIDLSYGNVIYYTSSSNTTVGFASTSAAEQITFIRDAGNSYTITWPDRVKWNNGTTPDLFNQTDSYQIFRLTTVDTGLKYNAWEDSASATSSGLFVSGYGSYGGLGLNDRVSRSSPTQLTGTWNLWKGLTWRSGMMSQLYGSTGTLWVMGYQTYGSLGLNDVLNRSSPTQIGTDSNWAFWALGEGSSTAVKTNGTLWSWGTGRYGNLGTNTGFNEHRSSPVQIGTNTNWGKTRGKIVSGYHTVLAIKTDGTLWSWGRNFLGQLGLNQGPGTPAYTYDNSKSSPTQIGTNTNWGNVWTGGNVDQTVMDTSGNLYGMGYNGDGRLGLNDKVDRSSPTQIPGTWTRCFGMSGVHVATKSDNTLWGWGSNQSGEIGINDRTSYSSPMQIPGSWDRDSLEFISQSAVVAKKVGVDGLWAWGMNYEGSWGINEGGPSYYSSPTQITTQSLTDYGLMGGNQFGKIIPDPFY